MAETSGRYAFVRAMPTLGDRQRTVDAAFGGDTEALLRVNPLDLLRTRSYPDSAGAFVVGADDEMYRPQLATRLGLTP